jgi:hypothetical protein
MAERAILAVAGGLFVGVLGLLIKYAGATQLIAGYDPERVTDEAGLADYVGTRTLLVAVLTVAVGLLEVWEPTADANWYWLGYVVAVFAVGAQMIRGARRFEDSETAQAE